MTTTLTLARRSKTTAAVMQGNHAVGHLGLFAGCCYVNGGATFGFAFVAHVSTLDSALAVFQDAVTAGMQNL